MSGIATQELVVLDLFANEALWTGVFDQLEVWRSRLSGHGPYELLCDDDYAPARLPVGAVGEASEAAGRSVALSGLTLDLQVQEAIEVPVVFAGTDPLTYAEAAAEISAAGGEVFTSFVLPSGMLVIESGAVGLSAILRVVGGDAAPLLGLATGEPLSVAFGRDPRIALVPGQSRYSFTDPNGSRSYFYRIRFFNSATREVSDFGPAFQVPPIARLSAASLVRGTLDIVDAAGNPTKNTTVLIYLRRQGHELEGKAVVGGTERKVTDKNGHVEFLLARGAGITVSVAGTDLSRDIEVPTDPAVESFNLLDPAYGKDDLFVVQRPNIPFAARRSL